MFFILALTLQIILIHLRYYDAMLISFSGSNEQTASSDHPVNVYTNTNALEHRC